MSRQLVFFVALTILTLNSFPSLIEAEQVVKVFEYNFEPFDSECTEYEGENYNLDEDLKEIRRILNGFSDKSANYDELNEPYKYEEPQPEPQPLSQDDQINASGVDHSKIVATWDQAAAAVHEDYSAKKQATVGRGRDNAVHKVQEARLATNKNSKSKVTHDRQPEQFNQLNYNQRNQYRLRGEREPRTSNVKRDVSFEEYMDKMVDNWLQARGLVEDDPQNPDELAVDEKNVTITPEVQQTPPSDLNVTVPPPLVNATSTTPPGVVKIEVVSTLIPPAQCGCMEGSTEKPEHHSIMKTLKKAWKRMFSKKKDDDDSSDKKQDEDVEKLLDNLNDEEASLFGDWLKSQEESQLVGASEESEASNDDKEATADLSQPIKVEDAALFSQKAEHNSSSKTSNLTSNDDEFKDFSKSDLSFMKNLISCMKKSSPELLIDESKKNTTHTVKGPKKSNSTLLGAIAANNTHNSHAFNLTTPGVLQNKTFTKNFTQFLVECQPIVVNYSNVSGKQFLSFNCTKRPMDNNTLKFERDAAANNESINDTMLNKLKYLAHMHHPVDMVGKQPVKTVDLKAIEEQIENAKYGELFNDDNDTVNDASGVVNPQSPVAEATDTKEPAKRSLDKFTVDDDDPFAVDSNEQIGANDIYAGYDELLDSDQSKRHRKNRRRPSSKSSNKVHGSGSQATGAAPKNPRTEVSEKFTDFDDIQLKLTPEQEMDIHKFSQSLDERPQQFHFDVDKYVAEQQSKLQHKSLFKPIVSQEAPRKYFEFEENADGEMQPLNSDLVGQDDEDDPNQDHEADVKEKRDLNAKFEGVRNMLRDKSSALPATAYDVDSLHADSYKKQLEKSRKETKDKFVDNYYFLNDAANVLKEEKNEEAEKEESKAEISHHEDMIPNSIDLDIDLKLSKEFEDLQFERDRILHHDVWESDMSGSNQRDKGLGQDIFNDIR